MYSDRAVLPLLQSISLGRSDRDIRLSLGFLVGSPLQMMIGGLPASGFCGGIGARSAGRALAACTRIWPGFDEYGTDGGLQRSDTESSLLSSSLLTADICGPFSAPSRPRSKQKSAATCQIRHHGSAVGWRISASTGSLDLASRRLVPC